MPTIMYCNWAASGSHRPAYTQVDRLGATEERCGEVESAIFDLFAHLGATEEQLDFPVLYASARQVIPAMGSPLHRRCQGHHTNVACVTRALRGSASCKQRPDGF